eukprot:sb/3477783/
MESCHDPKSQVPQRQWDTLNYPQLGKERVREIEREREREREREKREREMMSVYVRADTLLDHFDGAVTIWVFGGMFAGTCFQVDSLKWLYPPNYSTVLANSKFIC